MRHSQRHSQNQVHWLDALRGNCQLFVIQVECRRKIENDSNFEAVWKFRGSPFPKRRKSLRDLAQYSNLAFSTFATLFLSCTTPFSCYLLYSSSCAPGSWHESEALQDWQILAQKCRHRHHRKSLRRATVLRRRKYIRLWSSLRHLVTLWTGSNWIRQSHLWIPPKLWPANAPRW